MSAITKEQLQQIEAAAKEVLWPVVWSEKKARKHFSEKITPEVALELARIALASLEAEPVAYIFKHPAGRLFWLLTDESNKGQSDVISVYTAPPAPVSAPFAIHDEDFEKALSVLNDTLDDCGDSERGLLLALDKVGIEVRSDACRAATLQGADGNSPVIPDGWVLVPVDMAPEMMRAVQIESELGSYAAANLSGAYALFREFWDVAVAAAPQQEVK